ncbi:MAG: hypothetical protein MRY74_04160 [Neomegalonema sp.]|nr:hypothetical protein [Neomegalonema sp.]
MNRTVTSKDLGRSVLAVPPLALDEKGAFHAARNAQLINHIEKGGVSTLLYGGNALAHHWPLSQYSLWLDQIVEAARPETWVIPSIGADGGRLQDQAPMLRARGFPVAMVLPLIQPHTQAGMVAALTRAAEDSGAQLLLYVKTDDYIDTEALQRLDEAGVLFGVKYAVPRPAGAEDPYLRAIIDCLGADRIVSGFGEPPAVDHMARFKLAGFTAGCVCIAPSLSMAVLAALKEGDVAGAERTLKPLLPLEALRNEINEIRVLHDAVSLSGVAEMGPIPAPSSDAPASRRDDVSAAARALLAAENEFRAAKAA